MRTIDGDDDSYDTITKTFGDYMEKIWHNANGQYHRDGDLPAVIYHDGSVFYFRDGELHRDGDLPAVIYANGSVYYYKNGLCYRDGTFPAVILANDPIYYDNGNLHHESSPGYCLV